MEKTDGQSYWQELLARSNGILLKLAIICRISAVSEGYHDFRLSPMHLTPCVQPQRKYFSKTHKAWAQSLLDLLNRIF